MKPRNRIAAAICAGVLAAVGMAGCGGHGGGAAEAGDTAAATFRVLWPSRGRAIPNAAAKIVITAERISVPGVTIATGEADRDDTDDPVIVAGLPPNTPLRFILRAYALTVNAPGTIPPFGPDLDMTVPVASAERTVPSLQPGSNSNIPVTLESAVSRLSVTKVSGTMTGTGTQADPFVLPRNTGEESVLSVTAFTTINGQEAQVILRYDPTNGARNPQVLWKVNAGDPIRIVGGSPVSGSPTGVDVRVGTQGLIPGEYIVTVEFSDPDPNDTIRQLVYFRLDPESQTGFKDGVTSTTAVGNPGLIDLAVRGGSVGFVDDVFVFSRGAQQQVIVAGADARATPAANLQQVAPYTPLPPTLSRIARYGDTTGFIGAEAFDPGVSGDTARTRVFAFTRSPAGSFALTEYQMVNLGSGGPMSLGLADQIEDIDVAQNATTAYVLYEAAGMQNQNALRVGKLSRDFATFTETGRTLTYAGGASPRLALYQDSDNPANAVFFVAADNAVRKYGGGALPTGTPLTIPAGVQQGTIIDVACSSARVFVLAANPNRVHVFNADTAAYIGSRAIGAELPVVRAIASSVGSGDIFVAGLTTSGLAKFIVALEE